MLEFTFSNRNGDKWNSLRTPFAALKLLFLLNLPTALAQYSACSEACAAAGDTAFNIPSIAIYGAVAHNAAVCNNAPYIKAVGQCAAQNCGQQDTAVTIGLFINGCTSTGTPTQYTSAELLAWAAEFASTSTSSAAASITTASSTASYIVSTIAPTASPSVVTVGTSGSTILVSVSTPTATVVTIGVSPTGSSSSSNSSNTPTSSSKSKLSSGAVAGIVVGAIIAVALIALLIFLLIRSNRKNAKHSQQPPVIADEFGRAEMPGESKPIAAVSYIPVSAEEKPIVIPTSNVQNEPSPTTATMNEGPPISPASMPAELSQDSSATVTSPHQELPAYYAPHFEMAAETPNSNNLQAYPNNNYQTDIRRDTSVSTVGGTAREGINAGVEVMRAPDEELAWLEAEEEKIRKRRSELQRLGGGS